MSAGQKYDDDYMRSLDDEVNTTKRMKRSCSQFIKKFLLAIIVCGLIFGLVMQIIGVSNQTVVARSPEWLAGTTTTDNSGTSQTTTPDTEDTTPPDTEDTTPPDTEDTTPPDTEDTTPPAEETTPPADDDTTPPDEGNPDDEGTPAATI